MAMPFGGLRGLRLISGCLLVLAFAGCATERPLMPTPSIYEGPDSKLLFTGLPPVRRQPDMELIYVTDRARPTDPDDPLPYGAERSREIAFGTAVVEMGPALDWAELARQSRLGDRTEPVNLVLGEVTELGRFPATPYRMQSDGDSLNYEPAVLARHRGAKQGFLTLLEQRLAETARKEVVLYVHGFNETFESAMFTLAELCHFLGREFTCVLFTWPAGSGGSLLTGYGRDRESSEFGMFHLKKMIRTINSSPSVNEAHLLAHSRGTDVLLSAIRELAIERYAAGAAISESRIANIVLMAPDVDQDVATQRVSPLGSDPDIATSRANRAFPKSLTRMTVYVYPEDRALLASSVLFRSRRVGRFDLDDLKEDLVGFWKAIGFLNVIQVPQERTDLLGHSYFTTNRIVSSDLVSLIRYGVQPGDPRRALKPVIEPALWQLEAPTPAPL